MSTDKTTLQIKSKFANNALLVFKNVGSFHFTDKPETTQAAAAEEARQIKEFFDYNISGMLNAAIRGVYYEEHNMTPSRVMREVLRFNPNDFKLYVQAEDGHEVLEHISTGIIMMRGDKVMEPMLYNSVTDGNTISNKEIPLIEEPIKHDNNNSQEDDWEPSHPYRPSFPRGRHD